jgi:fumarate reductase subunit C
MVDWRIYLIRTVVWIFVVLFMDFLNYGVFGDMNGDLALQWLKSMTPARGLFCRNPLF